MRTGCMINIVNEELTNIFSVGFGSEKIYKRSERMV